jgi:hypothetical protein
VRHPTCLVTRFIDWDKSGGVFFSFFFLNMTTTLINEKFLRAKCVSILADENGRVNLTLRITVEMYIGERC